jgi:hypothetical protein
MEKVIELVQRINESGTVDTKMRRVHGMMRYLMETMDPSWDITDLLREKMDQWEAEGMSKKKVGEYRSFLKSM